MVTIEYRINSEQTSTFVATMNELASERRRDGAYVWSLFEDATESGHWLEFFLVESWAEHLLWGSVTSFHFSDFDRVSISGCSSPSG
jgi:quinol monooxygenase YgiN